MTFTIGHLLDDPADLFPWVNHAWTCLAVLKAASDSGLCAHLEDGPLSADELSAKIGWPVEKTNRIVAFLAAEAIVEVSEGGAISGTSRSRNLAQVASCIECSMIGIPAGARTDEALKQGLTPYQMEFGKPVFEHLADQPALAATFGDFMGYMTRRLEQFLFTQHDFAPFKVAADIGGSHGGLLLRLLADHRDARGILFDLPEVIARTGEAVLGAQHGDRVDIVGGSFFEAVPAADLYLLKMILHDWDDAECITILKNIRAEIAPDGRLAVIDHVLSESPIMTEGLSMDIAMMVWDTGRERKLSEFEALFNASGFKLDRVTENPSGQSVIEAVPV